MEAVSKDGALKLSDIAKYGAEEAGVYDDIGLEKTDTPDAHLSGRTFRDFKVPLASLKRTSGAQKSLRKQFAEHKCPNEVGGN
jgi:hypothetical protein